MVDSQLFKSNQICKGAKYERKISDVTPGGKQGVNISKIRYDVMRQAILAIIESSEGITFTEMTAAVEEKLAGNFDGSIPWYATTVKLDLEARREIERIPGSSPQQLRLKKR